MNVSHFDLLVSSDGPHSPLWGRSKDGGSTTQTYISKAKELINQLELSLGQPEEFVLGVIPGLSLLHTLEEFEVRDFKVKLLSKRSPAYLGRWFLRKLLSYGNLGQEERIIATFAFSKDKSLEELFHLIDRKIKKRKTDLVTRTYEFARQLYPILFPRLPDVRDANSAPAYLVVTEELKPRRIIKKHRPRNPSAVGGKNRQEIAFLPTLSQTGHEAHNVVMIFLSLEKMMRDVELQSTDLLHGEV
jgi:hypothetical protein